MRRSPARPRVGQAPHLRRRGPDLMRSGGDVPETWPVDAGLAPRARCGACNACCGCGLAPHAAPVDAGLAPHAAFPDKAPCGASPTPTRPWPRPDAVVRRRSRNLACGCGPCSACSIRGLLRMLWMRACTACQIRGLLRMLWMRACTARLPCRCGACPACGFPGKARCGASPTPTGPWPRPDAARRRRSRNQACGCGPRSACSIRGLLRMLWMRACTARLPCRCGACPACGVPRQGPVWGKPHTYGAVAPT